MCATLTEVSNSRLRMGGEWTNQRTRSATQASLSSDAGKAVIQRASLRTSSAAGVVAKTTTNATSAKSSTTTRPVMRLCRNLSLRKFTARSYKVRMTDTQLERALRDRVALTDSENEWRIQCIKDELERRAKAAPAK